jgi:oxygen-dependent protoporphyrinogen oxidase
MTDVVVAGGGIAGLAAADRLADAGVAVCLLESAERLGVSIHTVGFAGRALDVGAEMLATRQAAGIELCGELGLALVAPAAAQAHVWSGGRLRPLPAGMSGLLRSRILSPTGTLRAGFDLVAPSRAPVEDVSIGAIVRARLGRQALDRVVDPLLGGIHAGRCDELSARAAAPQLVAALAGGKGLIRGLGGAGRHPAFVTVRDGLGALTAALVGRLEEAGADVRVGCGVLAVAPAASGRVRVTARDGEALHPRACVLATPAPATARLLAAAAPAAARELAAVAHASVATVALAYPSLDGLPPGTGYLAGDRHCLVRACTWSSLKWSHLAGEPAIVKAFVGRAGDPPPEIADAALADLVHHELAQTLGVRERPRDVHVFRARIPQYHVGHLERVACIEEALPEGVHVAGAAYRGVGVPACVASGRAAAERVLERLGLPITRSHA